MVDDVAESSGHARVRGRVLDGALEQVGEPLQRVLVHVADVGHVRDAEEEEGAVLGDGAVPGSGLVDLRLGGVRHLLLLRDLIREELGRRQDLHRALVLQDVPLGRAQHLEDLILDLLELFLVLRALDDELIFLLRQIRAFLRDDDAEELIFQTV